VAGYRDPRYWPELQERARALGVDGRVRFVDFVPSDVLPHLYSAAAAVVMPSLYEGFGLPVLEAMACGAPVIASSAGALPEAAGDAALMVDPQDEAALAEAIQRVLDDPDLARDLRAKGLARARQFSWAETARRVLEVVERVVGA
jgi:glycosyltransferase involved in cell wall biosynthesis